MFFLRRMELYLVILFTEALYITRGTNLYLFHDDNQHGFLGVRSLILLNASGGTAAACSKAMEL